MLYHSMPPHEIKNCFPRHVIKSGKRNSNLAFYEAHIKEHATATSRGTLDRGFLLSCAVIEKAMKTETFFAEMKQDNDLDQISAINKFVLPTHIYYLFGDQFKAVSYKFIFHNFVRSDPQEEQLRMDLRKLLRFTTSHIIYDYLQFVISARLGKEADLMEKNGSGRALVKDNYHIMPGSRPASEVQKSLKRLPKFWPPLLT